AKQAAEDANRSKSEFIANVNHELRTPLTVIMGLAETLLMEMPDNKKEFPIHILKNAKQLLLLINDIIDLSKIESGKFSLAKKSFQLAETLDYIRQSFALETEKKGISLKILGPSIVLYGDHVRLKQILTNLVANAIKFTSQGGVTLTCEISSEEESKVVLLFEVQDTGIGIGESELNKIFERFYQIDGSNHRKYSGTGLGLSIVKQLVSLMNGSVWVKSQIGEGTTFYVRIPFALPNRPLKPSTNTEREVTTE
ncbi:MAG TPA: HAMP domain-containing sensor histidine kinase, partial [Thermotogota bacterium]|nr:HAMP domain-containing sensor histidine kinase [Thermotogota bacterium]